MQLVKCEEHCCGETLKVSKFLQIGVGKWRNILVVAESPAANGWRKSGRAFYTCEGKLIPTGKNLLSYLKLINPSFELKDISFTEISKCFIGNNRYKLDKCAAKTWNLFISQIEFVKPKIILLLGKKTTDIYNKLALSNVELGKLAKVSLNDCTYLVLSIYHPSPANPSRKNNEAIICSNLLAIEEAIS